MQSQLNESMEHLRAKTVPLQSAHLELLRANHVCLAECDQAHSHAGESLKRGARFVPRDYSRSLLDWEEHLVGDAQPA